MDHREERLWTEILVDKLQLFNEVRTMNHIILLPVDRRSLGVQRAVSQAKMLSSPVSPSSR